jgi:hypothetical protein
MQRTASSSIVKHRLPAKAKLVQVSATGDRSFFHLACSCGRLSHPAGMWAAARSLLAGIDKVFNNNCPCIGSSLDARFVLTVIYIITARRCN